MGVAKKVSTGTGPTITRHTEPMKPGICPEGTHAAAAGKGDSVDEKLKKSCLHKQLRKTKFCVYHLQGVCQFGENCAFAHSCGELQGAPDLRKTRLCRAFVNGGCKDRDCDFAHSEEELRSTDMFYKKTLCMWFEKGRCRNGEQCRFAHGETELRARVGSGKVDEGSSDTSAVRTSAQKLVAVRKAPTTPHRTGLADGVVQETQSSTTSTVTSLPIPEASAGSFSGTSQGAPVPAAPGTFVPTLRVAPSVVSSGSSVLEPMFVQAPATPLSPELEQARQFGELQRALAGYANLVSQARSPEQARQSGALNLHLNSLQLQLQHQAAVASALSLQAQEDRQATRSSYLQADLEKLTQNIAHLSVELSRCEAHMHRPTGQESLPPGLGLNAGHLASLSSTDVLSNNVLRSLSKQVAAQYRDTSMMNAARDLGKYSLRPQLQRSVG